MPATRMTSRGHRFLWCLRLLRFDRCQKDVNNDEVWISWNLSILPLLLGNIPQLSSRSPPLANKKKPAHEDEEHAVPLLRLLQGFIYPKCQGPCSTQSHPPSLSSPLLSLINTKHNLVMSFVTVVAVAVLAFLPSFVELPLYAKASPLFVVIGGPTVVGAASPSTTAWPSMSIDSRHAPNLVFAAVPTSVTSPLTIPGDTPSTPGHVAPLFTDRSVTTTNSASMATVTASADHTAPGLDVNDDDHGDQPRPSAALPSGETSATPARHTGANIRKVICIAVVIISEFY
jgi:hypothetical protein